MESVIGKQYAARVQSRRFEKGLHSAREVTRISIGARRLKQDFKL